MSDRDDVQGLVQRLREQQASMESCARQHIAVQSDAAWIVDDYRKAADTIERLSADVATMDSLRASNQILQDELAAVRAAYCRVSDERTFIPIDRADMDAISPCGHYMRFRLPCIDEDGNESMSCMQCSAQHERDEDSRPSVAANLRAMVKENYKLLAERDAQVREAEERAFIAGRTARQHQGRWLFPALSMMARWFQDDAMEAFAAYRRTRQPRDTSEGKP